MFAKIIAHTIQYIAYEFDAGTIKNESKKPTNEIDINIKKRMKFSLVGFFLSNINDLKIKIICKKIIDKKETHPPANNISI